MAFFCEKTGIRIAAPGVHVGVDPSGHHAVIEDGEGNLIQVAGGPDPSGSEPKPDKGSKKGEKPKEDPPASPDGGSEPKPDKGSK